MLLENFLNNLKSALGITIKVSIESLLNLFNELINFST
jgi:hypothetical protein